MPLRTPAAKLRIRAANPSLHRRHCNLVLQRRTTGRPLGLLFCALAIDLTIRNLRSTINIWYLDDGTLAGPTSTISGDIASLTLALQGIGLRLNS